MALTAKTVDEQANKIRALAEAAKVVNELFFRDKEKKANLVEKIVAKLETEVDNF